MVPQKVAGNQLVERSILERAPTAEEPYEYTIDVGVQAVIIQVGSAIELLANLGYSSASGLSLYVINRPIYLALYPTYPPPAAAPSIKLIIPLK